MRTGFNARLTLLCLVYLALAALVALSWQTLPAAGSNRYGELLFLLIAVLALSVPTVHLERGIMNLSAIPGIAAGLLLNPSQAALVGLFGGLAGFGLRMSEPAAVAQVVGDVLWTSLPSALRLGLVTHGFLSAYAQMVAVLANVSLNVLITAMNISANSSEPVTVVLGRIFTRSFAAAYLYFALAAVLLAHELTGSISGYIYGGIVALLALALADTLTTRRVRSFLEGQLSDADRHLMFSRAVEGVVHNLRNHVSSVKAHLDEVDPTNVDETKRDNLMTAKAATADAVAVLHRLSEGATPKVAISSDPIDLNEIVRGSAALAGPAARLKQIALSTRPSGTQALAYGDAVLLREVLTNLLMNAVDASPAGGHVGIECVQRDRGWAISVHDSGHGVPDVYRARLFEPHFTTKPNGTGMGLFVSYGIAREHGGHLFYEGSDTGGVFTIVLPSDLPEDRVQGVAVDRLDQDR